MWSKRLFSLGVFNIVCIILFSAFMVIVSPDSEPSEFFYIWIGISVLIIILSFYLLINYE